MTSVSEIGGRPGPSPSAEPTADVTGPFAQARVWVTGASRGLGRTIALDLSSAGARVALTARSEDLLGDVESTCSGPETLSVPGSVCDPADVDRIADVIADRWGGLDIAVHCAGISPDFVPADALTVEAWRSVIDTNLTGTFVVCQAAARLMPHGGSIITVSSVHARSAGGRLAAYSASKGGVESLTRALALDWAGRGIRVNCIAPGYFETDMTERLRNNDRQRGRILGHTPLGTLGSPSQLTAVVRLLGGPGGSYITGSTLAVDGGWTIQ